MRYIKKNSKGVKFYLHGRGNLFYFSPEINRKNLITKKEEIQEFKRKYKVTEYKQSGLLFATRM